MQHNMNILNSFHFFPNPGHFSKADCMNFIWCNVQRGVPFKALLIELCSSWDAVNAFTWPTGCHVLLRHQSINSVNP